MPKRVLIVEDNEIVNNVEKIIMERLGCVVDIAKTGEEALELVKKNLYSFILMDIDLPGIDGLKTTRRMRKIEKLSNTKPVPIIAITANDDILQNFKCKKAGIKEVYGKPYTIEIGKNIIDRYT